MSGEKTPDIETEHGRHADGDRLDGEHSGEHAAMHDDRAVTRTFTQEDVDRIIKERLGRERKTIREQILAEIKQKSEEELAIKRGEFEKVIAQRDQEIMMLREKVQTLEAYEDLANKRWEELKKSLPEAILLLAPDDDATPLERERWYLTKALPAMEKLRVEQEHQARPGNNPKDPHSLSRENTDRKRVSEYVKDLQRVGLYRW